MKRIALVILIALLALGMLIPSAFAEGERVFDSGNLFSPDEEAAIAEAIKDFQAETGMDFAVCTSASSQGGKSPQQIADAFYLKAGFGFGEELDGGLYYINMHDRDHYLATSGKLIDYMTDSRVESAISICQLYLTRGDCAGGALKMIETVKKYYKLGIPEGQYQYDVITGKPLTKRHKALTTSEILVSVIIAVAVGLIFAASVRSSYKLKGSTYDYDFRRNSTVDVTQSSDDYLRTTTTRTRKAEPPKGGGSFGGGGGSGVHSSGGHSFGGGGGKF